jgi:hypothetical protein
MNNPLILLAICFILSLIILFSIIWSSESELDKHIKRSFKDAENDVR